MKGAFIGRVTLPPAEELMQRLLTVSTDPRYIESIYPEIVSAAGRNVAARELVVRFIGSTRSLTAGLRSPADDLIPNWIDALVDVPEIRWAAHQILGGLPVD